MFEKHLDEYVPGIIKQYGRSKPVLIFNASRSSSQRLAVILSCTSLPKRTTSGSSNFTEALSTIEDRELVKCLKRGVGYHHAVS